jgi:hypothetical protein
MNVRLFVRVRMYFCYWLSGSMWLGVANGMGWNGWERIPECISQIIVDRSTWK